MTCWCIRLEISTHKSISSNDETGGGKIDGTDQEPLLWELFAAACSLQLQIHANVLEEVECCKNVSSCNMSSSYCSNISMDNALEESAIQFVLQEYLLQRNVFIPCLQDGESLYHFLP
jgi:hypothetical protein